MRPTIDTTTFRGVVISDLAVGDGRAGIAFTTDATVAVTPDDTVPDSNVRLIEDGEVFEVE